MSRGAGKPFLGRCRTLGGRYGASACLRNGLEPPSPPRFFRHSGIDIGGVEYLESARDGQIYLYDVNSLSNFVTDAPRLVGFDPFARFTDYLERRAFASRVIGAVAAS